MDSRRVSAYARETYQSIGMTLRLDLGDLQTSLIILDTYSWVILFHTYIYMENIYIRKGEARARDGYANTLNVPEVSKQRATPFPAI